METLKKFETLSSKDEKWIRYKHSHTHTYNSLNKTILKNKNNKADKTNIN